MRTGYSLWLRSQYFAPISQSLSLQTTSRNVVPLSGLLYPNFKNRLHRVGYEPDSHEWDYRQLLRQCLFLG